MQASLTELHVALNAHLLSGRASYRSAGIHHYIRHLIQHLDAVGEGVRFTALLGAAAEAPDAGITVMPSRWDTSGPGRRVLWEQVKLPQVLRRIGADVVHAPAFVAPLTSSVPAVTTIHDLSFIRFPQLFRPANRLYLKTMTRLSARRSQQLIAVSKHTARECERLLGVNPDMVTVVYHGVGDRFHPLPAQRVQAFRERRGLPERFVLFVGTLEPRKNLTRLIEGFARIETHEAKLVLVGGRGWLYEDLFARVEDLGLGETVLFPGYVPNEELVLWYNAATVFAYPSLYEGFGMPVTEAQACGTPVLTSDTTSLPEAAGEAAMIVDPEDVDAIGAGLRRLLEDEGLQQELSNRGRRHASGFTWTRTARETVEVYHRAGA
jgi:glycosyltransferase involved in cell wall biosynthesis